MARQRRSFSQKTLQVRHEGPLGATLAEALHVPPEGGYELTHAFHPYPGRFHPILPRTLLHAVAAPGQRVLDPFMGGGTVLVARERTRPRTAQQAARVSHEAERMARTVTSLRESPRAPRVALARLDWLRTQHPPHLLAELLQWRRLLDEVRDTTVRETLRAVFSSGVVKFSNRQSDSRAESAPPGYRKGSVSRFLRRKTEQLVAAQVALKERLPEGWRHARLFQEDARLLPSFGWGECDHIVTSPPYPGTYDYHEHHRLRMAWLGLDDSALAAGEIGARRETRQQRWREGLLDSLGAMARVLEPRGTLYMVIGDWFEGDQAVDAAQALQRAAEQKGWRLQSWASARREVFSAPERQVYARKGKWEHLLQLVRG